MTRRVLAAILAIVLLSACSEEGNVSAHSDYVAVSDDVIFAQIADLPGVDEVDIHYDDSFGSARGYLGQVRASGVGDPLALLDKIMVILRQGREDASMPFDLVVVGTGVFNRRSLGINGQADLDERYGPQVSAE